MGIGDEGLKHEFDPEKHAKTYTCLEEITSIIDRESAETLLNTAVIIDVSDVEENLSSSLNPTSSTDSIGQTISSLILAFPEVYWILLGLAFNKPENSVKVDSPPNSDLNHFQHKLLYDDARARLIFEGIMTEEEKEALLKIQSGESWENAINELFCNSCPSWEKEHFANVTNMMECIELLRRHQNGYKPLFDPSGLRTFIKREIIESEKGRKISVPEEIKNILNDRAIKRAAAIDEEFPYTFLNGYVAYRFGYRCYMVTTLAEMDKLNCCRELDTAFEDMELLFSDMTPDDENKINGKLDKNALEVRREIYTFLPPLKKTLIITGVGDESEYITKPFPGLYALRDKMEERGQLEDVWQNYKKTPSIKQLGIFGQLTSLFCKGDEIRVHPEQNEIQSETKTHGAPNRILLIANSLINRARRMASNANSCQEAVHGAVLALEAKELLHSRSMTTALEALSLQHNMEVTAECSFYGVAQEIQTGPRFEEIAYETDKIVKIGDNIKAHKLAQSYNAHIEMLNNIRLVFRKYEQFDEEGKCLIRIRGILQALHFYSKFSLLRPCNKCSSARKSRGFILFLKSTVESYYNWLISSLCKMSIAIIGWILLFSLLYSVFLLLAYPQDYKLGFDSITLFHSAITFFMIEPSGILWDEVSGDKVFRGITLLELIISYVHLGILIAYLFQKISRR